MKRLALCLLFASTLIGLRAQTADADFLRIYTAIQEGEALERAGQWNRALEKYQGARIDLDAFARANPSWNRKIVSFRLGFLAEKLGSLKEKVPAVTTADPSPGLTAGNPAALATSAPSVASPSAGAPGLTVPHSQILDAERRASAAEARADAALLAADQATAEANEMRDRASRLALDLQLARNRVEALEAAKDNLERTRARLEREQTTLQAKLSEALRPRAAGLDPAEFARAQERNRLLAKENEILKACLDRQVEENKRNVELAKRASEFEQQVQAARSELSVARREADDLRQEREKLQAQLDRTTRKSAEETAALRKEVDSLRKDLDLARYSKSAPDSAREIALLQEALANERTASEGLRRENVSLRRELDRVGAIRVTPASLKVPEMATDDSAYAEAARVRRWERERDELRRQLESAHEELRRRESPPSPRANELEARVSQLEANLRVFAVQREPYTPEELALFDVAAQVEALRPLQLAQAKPSDPTPTRPPATTDPATSPSTTTKSPAPASGTGNDPTNSVPAAPVPSVGTNTTAASGTNTVSRRRTTKDLPPGAGQLARQAERAFTVRRLDEAERAYREILEMDQNNIYTLGNLAMILVEEGKTQEGEELVKRALALDPQDPFNLSLLGLIRFRQQKFDEAFDALSRSAELDPENAETFNYLGITLSERGDRKAAEAALRKALKLNPNSAMAHYNLAVVYATQKPPFLQLARFHYQKARRAGQPANPGFEKILSGEAPPSETETNTP